MPAPMTQTSAWMFSCSGGNCGIATSAQTDRWSAIRAPVQEIFLGGFLAQCDELFRRGGMDPDGGVELRLGGAELHRDRHALDDLAGVGADHVRPHHALARLVDDQLHERALFLV